MPVQAGLSRLNHQGSKLLRGTNSEVTLYVTAPDHEPAAQAASGADCELPQMPDGNLDLPSSPTTMKVDLARDGLNVSASRI